MFYKVFEVFISDLNDCSIFSRKVFQVFVQFLGCQVGVLVRAPARTSQFIITFRSNSVVFHVQELTGFIINIGTFFLL